MLLLWMCMVLTTCYCQRDSDSLVCCAVWIIMKHAIAVGCWVCWFIHRLTRMYVLKQGKKNSKIGYSVISVCCKGDGWQQWSRICACFSFSAELVNKCRHLPFWESNQDHHPFLNTFRIASPRDSSIPCGSSNMYAIEWECTYSTSETGISESSVRIIPNLCMSK